MSGDCSPCTGVGVNGGPGGGSAPPAFNPFFDEVVFAGQTIGNVNTAGNNNYTTAGGITLGWTGQDTGVGATTFDITAAGLRCVLNNVNTTWTNAAQTGPGIWIPLSSLYTAYASRGWDASSDVLFRIYASTITWTGNTVAPSGFHLALWGIAGTPSNSAARYASTIQSQQLGVPSISSRINATGGSNYVTAPADTANAFGLNSRAGNLQILGGVWGGSWAATLFPIEANTRDGTATTNSSFRDQNNRLAITFSTGSVAIANSTIVVERIRWDVFPNKFAA